MLGAIAFSLTYAVLTLKLRAGRLALVTANAMSPRWRTFFVGWLVAIPAIVIAGALIAVWRRGDEAALRVTKLSRVLLPLAAAGALPMLLTPGAADGRELPFLVVVGLLACFVERTIHGALELTWGASAALPLANRGIRRRWDLATAAIVVLYVGLTWWGSVRLHDKLLTSNFDLGLFENLFYNTLHGRHGIAIGRTYFGEHAEFLLYPLVPIYALAPRTSTLLGLQSVFMGGAAIPIYLLARRWLGASQAFLATAIYLLYPALHGPNLYDFHFLPLSIFFVAWAGYFFFANRWVLFWIAVVLALACREDVALGAAAIGLALTMHRWRRRVGAYLFVVSAVWFLFTKFVFIAHFGGQAFSWYYADLIPDGEKGFAGVLRTVISNPL
ncbi:MAG: DUF2079 domain-containing protein, partial [Polyangiaceae bacterium]